MISAILLPLLFWVSNASVTDAFGWDIQPSAQESIERFLAPFEKTTRLGDCHIWTEKKPRRSNPEEMAYTLAVQKYGEETLRVRIHPDYRRTRIEFGSGEDWVVNRLETLHARIEILRQRHSTTATRLHLVLQSQHGKIKTTLSCG
ncbi:MAG: hypothetical protein NDJ89_10555 [Oligoflexia bacterium]|nr:hypothetical protein [Oligoflexia bacterium]